MIFPKPCICQTDRKGIDFNNISGWIAKVREEHNEVIDSAHSYWGDRILLEKGESKEVCRKDVEFSRKRLAEELADLITVCVSFLNWLGYNEEARSKLFKQISEKNLKRGNFKK